MLSGIARIIGISQSYLHSLHFVCERNELYLPLPSQLQLVTHLPTPEGWKAE